MYDDWAYQPAETYTAPENISVSPQKATGGRRRAHSILQAVAIDAKTKTSETVDEAVDEAGIGDVFLPEVSLPQRRANSFLSLDRDSIRNEISDSLSAMKVNDYPFTRQERNNMLKSDLELEVSLELSSDVNFQQEIDAFFYANNTEYISFRDAGNLHTQSCADLMLQIDSVLNQFSSLSLDFQSVQNETRQFQAACDTLLVDQIRLQKLSDEISHNLEYFNRLETITNKLNTPGAEFVCQDSFKDLLSELDECLEYTAKNKNFKNIDVYQHRFRQCMTRALTLISVYFTNKLRDISQEAQEMISIKGLNSATQSALLYARFVPLAPQLRGLVTEIYTRCKDHEEYEGIYHECISHYFSVRQRLLSPIIAREIDGFTKDNRVMVDFAYSCITIYKNICSEEYTLFFAFFDNNYDSDERDDTDLYSWFQDLCEPLYDVLRNRIIHENNVSNLCELTSLLQDLSAETANEEDEYYDRNVDYDDVNYGRILFRILQDAQSRLVFKVQSYVDTEIVRYVPKNEDFSVLGQRKKSTATVDSENLTNEDTETAIGSRRQQFNTESLFKGWYVPMKNAVQLLSQIYQLVNSRVFDDLAHNVVHECLISIKRASDFLQQKSGAQDGLLFLIKHLIILKDQITEFDIQYVPSEVEIDFSGLGELISTIRTSGISFSSEGLMSLARVGVPKVVNNMLDAREELFANLRNAINEFTESSLQPIISSISQVDPKPETITEDTMQLRQQVAVELPRIYEKIKFYINDIHATDILMDAIQNLVIQAYETYQERILKQKPDYTLIEGMMEVDGLVSWISDITGRLKLGSEIEDQEREETDSISVKSITS
ncbi:Sec34-domain-containing protein [Nadsonia fulvescens var. elongata DSM 6958]|uniref:Conserved oligomeric Golgi complex subunit 3 n=1 Tax=Nadsonia fulvescens var. elongata DSM 6958 TaxID=857566 RepID=A0A1E3PJ02_9ASCO|nr:Sec34-domain-containing protein [Nadsonia fulvescens var. elongata DSM 6958]